MITGLCVMVAAAYLWRWRRTAVAPARAAAFVLGVAALWAAVGSPLAGLDDHRLVGHMLQHLLIMTVAAPLVLLGEPLLVAAGGGPAARRGVTVPPAICWLAGTLTVLGWHVPAAFAFGMRWHALQHATFLVAGLLFWVPVIQPWPTERRWSRWSIPVYLFLATMPCDALSAFLTFCGRVVYPHYDAAHGHPALDDQMHAGALMWFWVTIIYLVPAALVTIQLLSPRRRIMPGGRVTTWPKHPF